MFSPSFRSFFQKISWILRFIEDCFKNEKFIQKAPTNEIMKIKRNIVHSWAYQSTKTWKNDEKNSDRHKHNTVYKSRIYIRANRSRKPIIQQRTNKCFYACHYNIFEIICVQLKSRKRNWNRNRTRWVILKQGQLWFLFHSSAFCTLPNPNPNTLDCHQVGWN